MAKEQKERGGGGAAEERWKWGWRGGVEGKEISVSAKVFIKIFETNDLCVLLLKLPGASCYFYANNNLTPLLLLFLLELLQHDPREEGRADEVLGEREGGWGAGRYEVRKGTKRGKCSGRATEGTTKEEEEIV